MLEHTRGGGDKHIREIPVSGKILRTAGNIPLDVSAAAKGDDVTTDGKENHGINIIAEDHGNDVIAKIILTPCNFEHPSRWYYRLQEKNDFGIA
jgi:hypothetical protein